jgi:lactoylglutathione lyase
MTARHAITILAVEDLARSVAFYEAAFGWPRSVTAPSYVELELPNGMRFGLYARDGWAKNVGRSPEKIPEGKISATELYFYTDDLTSAIERMRRSGATELSARAPRSWGDEAAYFGDPDGNVLVVAKSLGLNGGP